MNGDNSKILSPLIFIWAAAHPVLDLSWRSGQNYVFVYVCVSFCDSRIHLRFFHCYLFHIFEFRAFVPKFTWLRKKTHMKRKRQTKRPNLTKGLENNVWKTQQRIHFPAKPKAVPVWVNLWNATVRPSAQPMMRLGEMALANTPVSWTGGELAF